MQVVWGSARNTTAADPQTRGEPQGPQMRRSAARLGRDRARSRPRWRTSPSRTC